jgi:hypothetical protein
LRLEQEKKYEELTRKKSQLMAEGIILLRKRVEEENGISDETISAVAILAAIEVDIPYSGRNLVLMFEKA